MKRLIFPVALAAGLVLAGAGFVVAQPTEPTNVPPPPGLEEAPPAEVAPPPPVPVAPPPATVTPAAPPPQAKSTTPTPVDKPPPAMKRTRSSYAVMQVLDKVTAETLRFQAPVGGAVRYKTLVFQVRACESSAPDEDLIDSAAYLVVTSQPLSPGGGVPPPAKQVYRGWMYASSPGLNPLQHPVYDAWVIACNAPAPSAPAKR